VRARSPGFALRLRLRVTAARKALRQSAARCARLARGLTHRNAQALSQDTAGDASPARKPRAAPVARAATPPPSPSAAPEGRRGPPPEPKPKLSKAERRELQESQRAAKAVRQGGDAPAKPPPKPVRNASPALILCLPRAEASLPQDAPRPAEPAPAAAAAGGAAARGAPAGGAPRRGVPVPEAVQFDDKRVVARLQRKSLVPRKESGRAVELFAHLPQFDHQSLQVRPSRKPPATRHAQRSCIPAINPTCAALRFRPRSPSLTRSARCRMRWRRARSSQAARGRCTRR
jgi:hypothetical protein